MRRTRIALLAFALLSLPAAAFAAPATVTVFEAQVHAAPDRSSPVIHRFAEKAHISVSEEAIDGFRKVRLPNGKVGYIEEQAISLAPRAGPPPGAPPPPSVGPPPPPMTPPPPPPGYPFAPYRRVILVDPYAFRHVGFYLRFGFGMGYMDASTNASQTLFIFNSSHGFALDFDFAIGGAVKENVILAGEFWSTWLPSPDLTLRGVSVPRGSGFWNSTYGFGPQFTFYLMPSNVFFSVTPSMTWTSFSDYYASYTTDLGFGMRVKVGKEWYVAPHWGVGAAGWFVFSTNKEGGGASATWNTYAGGLGFTTTFN